MILYVFSKNLGRTRRETGHSASEHPLIVIPDESNVQDIANRIIAAAVNERSIWMLRIVCHGLPGQLLIGRGINAGNANLLNPIAPYFTPGGRGIELHACYVASAETIAPVIDVSGGGASPHRSERGTPGGRSGLGGAFLTAMAGATGVNVVGGYDLQWDDPTFGWEGRGTMTAEPSGTTTTTIAGE